VTFPKVDTSEMEEYGVETYGSIEGRKAMNKTLASKAILPLTEESLAPIIPTCTDCRQSRRRSVRVSLT
jgi:hypothetical protein